MMDGVVVGSIFRHVVIIGVHCWLSIPPEPQPLPLLLPLVCLRFQDCFLTKLSNECPGMNLPNRQCSHSLDDQKTQSVGAWLLDLDF